MANAVGKGKGTGGFLARMFDFTIYKKTQGRRSRQLTAAGIGVMVVMGCRELMLWLESLTNLSPVVQYGVPALLLAAAALALFRMVNSPRFSDFLIATEAEMSKVNWSSKQELKNATVVVLTLTLLMAAYLFLMDRVWEELLKSIGVLHLYESNQDAVSSLERVLDVLTRLV